MESTFSSMNEGAECCPGCIGYYLRFVGEDRVKLAFRHFICSLEAAFTDSNVCVFSQKKMREQFLQMFLVGQH